MWIRKFVLIENTYWEVFSKRGALEWSYTETYCIVKIHERQLCVSLQLKLQVMLLFWKLALSQVFLKKSDHRFNWLLLRTIIFLKNLFFTITVTVVSKDGQESLKSYVLTHNFI